MNKWLSDNFYIFVAFFATSVFICNDAFLPSIPVMSQDIGVSSSTTQLLLTAFVLGSVISLIPVGVISDKYGRKIPLLIGGLIFVIASAVCGVSENFYMLFAGRVVEGFGTGFVWGCGVAAISEYYQGHKGTVALSLTINLLMLAPLAGPVVGAIILNSLGWHYVFILDAVFMALVLVALFLYMPSNTKRHQNEQSNALTAAELSVETPASFKETLRGLGQLMKHKEFVFYSLISTVVGFTVPIWITAAPIMLMDNLHVSANTYSFWQVPIFVCFILGNSLAPILLKKFELKKYVTTLVFITGFTFISFLTIPSLGHFTLKSIILTLSVYMFFWGMLNAPLNQFIIDLEPVFKGSASSLMSVIQFMGILLGTLVSSYMSSIHASNHSYMYCLSLAMIMGLVMMVTMLIKQAVVKPKQVSIS